MVSPTNILSNKRIMCLKCSNSVHNGVFAEIAQQYLVYIGIAEIEIDLKYKPKSLYDLYIIKDNLIIEIQSDYHIGKEEYDKNKKEHAISLGYNFEYVDSKDDIFQFLKRFDNNVTWDKILNIIDLKKMLITKIVQLNKEGNLMKIWHGGAPEIKYVLGYNSTAINKCIKGTYGNQIHFYKDCLWYNYNEYLTDDFKCQYITQDIINNSNKCRRLYDYIAIKNNITVYANSMRELEKLINIDTSVISMCVNNKRNTAKGYIIKRQLKIL